MNDQPNVPATRVVLFPRNERERSALAKEFKELFDGFLPGDNGEARFTPEPYDSQKSAANPVLAQLAQRLSAHRVFNARAHQAQIEASAKDAHRNPLRITVLGKDDTELFSLNGTNVNLFLEGMPEELKHFKPYFEKYTNQKVLTGVAYYYRQVCLEYYFGEAFLERFGVAPKNSEMRIKCIDEENIELEFCVSNTTNADQHVKFKPAFKNKFTLTLALKFDRNAPPQENVLPIDITLKDAKFEIEQRRGTGLLHVTMGDERKVLDKNNPGTPSLIESVIRLEDPEIQARLETIFLEAEQRRGQILLNKLIDFEQSLLREDVKSTLVEQGLNDAELRPLLFNIFSTEKLRLGDVLPTLKIDSQLKLLTELFKSPYLSCLSTVDTVLAKTLYPQILRTMNENNQRQCIKRLNECQKKNTIDWFGEYMLDNIDIFRKTLETMSYEQLQNDIRTENLVLTLVNSTLADENAPPARRQNAASLKPIVELADSIKTNGRAFEQRARTLTLAGRKNIVKNLPTKISPDVNLQSVFSLLLNDLTPAQKLEVYDAFPLQGTAHAETMAVFNQNILQSPELTAFTENNSPALLKNSTTTQLKRFAVLDPTGKTLAKIIVGAERAPRPYNFFERHFPSIFKQKRNENALIEKQRQALAEVTPETFVTVFETADQNSLNTMLGSNFYQVNFDRLYSKLTGLLTSPVQENLDIKINFARLLTLAAQNNAPEQIKRKMRKLVLDLSVPSFDNERSYKLNLELFKILFSKLDNFKLLLSNEERLSPEIEAVLLFSDDQELRDLINTRMREHKAMSPGFNDDYHASQNFPTANFLVQKPLSPKDETTPKSSVLSDTTGKILAETIEAAQRKPREVNSPDVFARQEALDENELIVQSQIILSEIAPEEVSRILETASVEFSEKIEQFYRPKVVLEAEPQKPIQRSPSASKIVSATGSPRSDGSPDLTPEIERRAAKMEDIAQQLPAEASPAAEKTASQTKLHAKDQGPKGKEEADAYSVTQKKHVVRGLF